MKHNNLRHKFLFLIFFSIFTLLSRLVLISQIIATNPIFTNIYTADPSAHVWSDGRLYVYPSHDIDPPQGCDLMDKYHVYSTNDMVTWTDHGEILQASQTAPWGRPEGGFMWAPDCAYKNGTYYFYFPHPSGAGSAWNSTWKIGVATSSQPASGFVVQGYIKGLQSQIDPCVFVDDDGQAYFYYGGGGTCKGGKLKASMMDVDTTTMQNMTGLVDFHEATWVHKRNGVYYLSHADNYGPGGNRLRYAMSSSPLGPWTDKGVYMDPTGSATDHGSIVEYKGQAYAFYHNSVLSGGHDWLRSVCVDKLYYNADGTIQKVIQRKDYGTAYGGNPRQIPGTIQVEDYNDGGQGKGYGDSDAKNTPGLYRPNEGVDIESYSAGNYSIGYTTNGEYTNYSVDVTQDGLYDAQCIVASGNTNGGSFRLDFDDVIITAVTQVPNSGGWGTFTTVTISGIKLKKGLHNLKFTTYGGMNIDKFIFVASAPYSGTAYNGIPANVPGVVEAEKYDVGGEGLAYHDTDPTNKSGQFRNDGVDIESLGGGNYNLSWMEGGEWMKYILNVTQTGTYDVKCLISVGNASASFNLEFDDVYDYDLKTQANTGWPNYVTVTVSGVTFATTGKHVMRFNTNGGMNLDKCTFVKTSIATGIEEIKNKQVLVYPNPANDQLTIQTNYTIITSLRIADLEGRVVYTNDIPFTGNKTIDLNALSKGMYLISIQSEEGIQVTKFSIN